MVVAVAQREQLHSAPHTSFVSGLSWLSNGAPHLLHEAQTNAWDWGRASRVGPGHSLLSLHEDGEGPGSSG